MKKNIKLITLLCCMLVSCQTSKNTSYMQDAVNRSTQKKTAISGIKFQPNDLLSITVSSRKPEMATPFNLPSKPPTAAQTTLGYLVDMEGNIDFPIFGKIKVAGFSLTQLAEELKRKLIREDLIPDPSITIEILNFQISVLGEVKSPGTFTVSDDRITILQALGKAGDLTIYGKRNNVLVQREKGDTFTYYRVDLRSVEMVHSPVYYLQQNDVVYVESTNARAAQSKINENRSVTMWASFASLMISLAVLLVK